MRIVWIRFRDEVVKISVSRNKRECERGVAAGAPPDPDAVTGPEFDENAPQLGVPLWVARTGNEMLSRHVH
jgi:hypothetical protein